MGTETGYTAAVALANTAGLGQGPLWLSGPYVSHTMLETCWTATTGMSN